jgi:hypothetical protein
MTLTQDLIPIQLIWERYKRRGSFNSSKRTQRRSWDCARGAAARRGGLGRVEGHQWRSYLSPRTITR